MAGLTMGPHKAEARRLNSTWVPHTGGRDLEPHLRLPRCVRGKLDGK